MQLIDFHVHAGVFSRLRADIQGLLTARPMEADVDVRVLFSGREQLERYLSRNGVTRAVVLAECGPGTNFSIDSQMIVDLVGDSTMLIPFGSVNPNWHQSPMLEWERSVKSGVRGFKFYPADHAFDPITDPMMAVYQACEEQALPIVFHTGSTAQKDTEQRFIHPHDFLPIVESFPQLNIVLAHAGKPDWCAEALDMTERYPHVYVDTGLVALSSLMAHGLEQREARFKVLFGSDWPVCGSYEALLKRHAEVQMSDALRQQIFHDNAARLLADMEKHWLQPKLGFVSNFNAA